MNAMKTSSPVIMPTMLYDTTSMFMLVSRARNVSGIRTMACPIGVIEDPMPTHIARPRIIICGKRSPFFKPSSLNNSSAIGMKTNKAAV